MKEYKKAKYYYQVAIQADPCRAEAYNNLGVTLFNLSGKMEAVRNFNKAIDLRKEYLDPRRNIKSIQTGVDDLKITIRELRDNLMVY